MQVKREHLAGLQLALSIADTVCTDSISVSELQRLIAEAQAAPKPAGCGAKLAAGQYFSFCGETDMGQSMPALCDQCGGGFKPDCP